MIFFKLYYLIFLSAAIIALNGCSPLLNIISGSGNVSAYSEAIDDFDMIQVNDACELNVRYGKKFSVVINIDDNMHDYIEVFKNGNELIIRMKNFYSYTHYTAKVDITIPEVKKVTASDASQTTITGFPENKYLLLIAEDASTISGDCNTDTLNVQLSDASTAELSGIAKFLTLKLKDASNAKLSALESDDVTVSLEDASTATIDVSKSISGKIEDASKLRYSGTASCTVKSDLSSDIERL